MLLAFYRIKNICSSSVLYETEVKIFKTILFNSWYNKRLVDNLILKIQRDFDKPKFIGPLPRPLYFGMNYLGKNSDLYQKRLKIMFDNLNLNSQKLVFYFNRSRSLADVFSKNVKNFGQDEGLTGIYKIPCKNCNQNYIGETGRPFSIRLSEHRKFSGPVGKYASFDHKLNYSHDFGYEHSKIVYPESNLYRRKVIESRVMKENNLFENNSSSYQLEVFLNLSLCNVRRLSWFGFSVLEVSVWWSVAINFAAFSFSVADLFIAWRWLMYFSRNIVNLINGL